MIVLKTERLCLRLLTINDAEDLYRLNLDPEVIQYTGDVPFNSIEDAKGFLDSYDQYRKYGCGRWAAVSKTTDEFLGWCGLSYSPESGEYDLGFRFFRSKWNRGYATESALACVGYGFEKLGLTRIVGRAMKENSASITVLEKCGFKFEAPIDFGGFEGAVYSLEMGGAQGCML